MTVGQPVSGLEHIALQLEGLLADLPDVAARVGRLVEGLVVRPVCAEDQEEVSRLRYRAYRHAGAIDRNSSGAIWEECDADGNARTFAVLLDGLPLASIRVHVVRGFDASSPACSVFPDTVAEWLADDRAIIDSSCFCVEPVLARRFPQLALAAVRVPVVLAQAFAPSWLIATPRRGHEGFYLRNFGGKRLAEPRPYPGRERPLALVGNRMELITERIFRRYPSFRASEREQEAMRAVYEGGAA